MKNQLEPTPSGGRFLKCYQILVKRANSGSSGPIEEVKKENHQNLTPKMIGKSNSVQLRMFGRKRALIFTRKMVKNFIRLLWSVHRKNSPWTWPANGQTRLVLLRNDQNKIINQQNRNIISTISNPYLLKLGFFWDTLYYGDILFIMVNPWRLAFQSGLSKAKADMSTPLKRLCLSR